MRTEAAQPGPGHNANAPNGGALLQFIERIEDFDEQRAAIVAKIAAVKRDAKGFGFDLRALNQMLRERRMADHERREYAAMIELYRAALGMLDGTPLGDAARQRLVKPAAGPNGAPEAGEPGPGPAASPPHGAETSAEARAAGGDAARDGVKVTANPFPFGDPRRAAWDEGWCSATGSDGMDVPAAWRRKPQAKARPKSDGGDGGDV